MSDKRLNPEDLQVVSFSASDDTQAPADPFDPWCCTGCDSGCGIIPTGGGCESGGGYTSDEYCY